MKSEIIHELHTTITFTAMNLGFLMQYSCSYSLS